MQKTCIRLIVGAFKADQSIEGSLPIVGPDLSCCMKGSTPEICIEGKCRVFRLLWK
ncbi:unnamed protein product [Sphenostylis stenocarpa]|uniref:Uncharacterized protein n=1 Tax=Sphenostylis stenocarpa TaxID=92480 RepID=A0AA86W4E0_9FABA|nr:unnamed protein product [Sphenostylis stenocarpa]